VGSLASVNLLLPASCGPSATTALVMLADAIKRVGRIEEAK